MTMNDDAQKTAEELADDDQQVVVVTGLQVGTDGRLHVPKSTRERYDIGEGDYVDAVLVTDKK